MKQRNASLRLIMMATAISLTGSGCTKEDAPPAVAPVSAKPAVAESPPASADALSLLDLKMAKNQAGKPVLRGSISNSSPHRIKYATATFKLFDKKGREIGTSTASVDDLEAKFAWTFEVEIMQEGAVSAKFAGFTAK